jgi:hypothetical protein
MICSFWLMLLGLRLARSSKRRLNHLDNGLELFMWPNPHYREVGREKLVYVAPATNNISLPGFF